MDKAMTREAFLDEACLLVDKGYTPRLESDGMIVITSPVGIDHCVITAVAEMRTGEWFGMSEVYAAGRRLGLSPSLCECIADANDFPDYEAWYRDRLRQRLLEGLKLIRPTPHAQGHEA